jgi:hypothetical protein
MVGLQKQSSQVSGLKSSSTSGMKSSSKPAPVPLKGGKSGKEDDFVEMSDDSDLDPVPLNVSNSNKRPNSADSSDSENENKDKKDGNQEPVQELLRVKRARYAKPFSEELLLNPNGLEKLYYEFPLNCKFSPKFTTEEEYLKRLLTFYKEWAFQLHPGLSFLDVASKCEMLGSKSAVKNYVNRLRDKERDRFTVRD